MKDNTEKPPYIPTELPQTKTEKVLMTIINQTLNLIIKLYEKIQTR